jgi:hypothetical protein
MADCDPNPRDLIKMFRAEPLRTWPISTRANKPENDDPAIVEPIDGGRSVATSKARERISARFSTAAMGPQTDIA